MTEKDVPDEFQKVTKDFYKDVLTTFPEYKEEFNSYKERLYKWTEKLYKFYVDCFIYKSIILKNCTNLLTPKTLAASN